MSPKKRVRPVKTPSLKPRRQPPRCNDLDGKRWLQNSISVWGDLRKTAEEQRLKHPAQFPVALAERLIESFLPATGAHVILDPFAGSGSTLVAAQRRGKSSIGFELSADYVRLAQSRLQPDGPSAVLHQSSASALTDFIAADSIDLCITSPPYWNILGQKRTADYKSIRDYGNLPGDLGLITDYEAYLDALAEVFQQVFATLKPGAHCCINVMDLRKKDRFYPLHSDLARRLERVGYRLDDLIIWNRQAEYNSLRPLGYPAVFRINKVHEYIVLMQKPGRLGRD
ncbi:MAG TPA: site-specific DNA-methyltransferase [Planctomycetaceae bacterium]|nr:site-specific DNA-methyltransferase [Planctomycetaceae bacterium]